MSEKQTCETCKYWKEFDPDIYGFDGIGHCLRYPPYQRQFQQAHSHEWCGEWKAGPNFKCAPTEIPPGPVYR